MCLSVIFLWNGKQEDTDLANKPEKLLKMSTIYQKDSRKNYISNINNDFGFTNLFKKR